jgi:hypothetical protein
MVEPALSDRCIGIGNDVELGAESAATQKEIDVSLVRVVRDISNGRIAGINNKRNRR